MIGKNPFRSESHVTRSAAHLRLADASSDEPAADAGQLLVRVGRGDEQAFAAVYDLLGASVYGLARRVVRDPARAEEIAQEVFIQVWQSAARFDPARGSAKGWVMTLAHRRAVDAVRHDQAATNRENSYDWSNGPDYDEVEETVSMTLEHEQVRRCLEGLTELQREAVNLAYYNGHTYAEVAEVLDANPATIKTRIRDGLVRLRDCIGVPA
ncbi:sigma-70 family RNA polymerase sigma factor [Aeromicrobium ginsengisoli]|uniref:Sigma-70 family RNA polymerase sigma factor n=1 Tax=Aeromicrobium ginsengisoli TaxID=363867 RepID=A0A5M4FD55_9ACTN|nr:sigma-70 family RNA polymerase sigma factor [Aeromicrobium ginsengisoli]